MNINNKNPLSPSWRSYRTFYHSFLCFGSKTYLSEIHIKLLKVLIVLTVFLLIGSFNSAWCQDDVPKKEEAFYINEFEFSGNELIDTDILQKEVQQFKSQNLTIEDLDQLTRLVTMMYQKRGYILARAYIPEQEITEGILKIAILEGRIGKIRVANKTKYHDRVVKRYFKNLQKDSVLNEKTLEKSLLLSRNTPNIKTRAVLKQGENPGTVDIDLITEETSAIKMALGYNNFGSDVISKDIYTVSMNLTELYWGSSLDAKAMVGRNPEDTFSGFLNYKLPINSYGTQINASYFNGDYQVGEDLANLGLEGDTEIFGFNLIHPFMLEKNKELKLTFGYDHKLTENHLTQEVNSIDEIDEAYVSFDYYNIDRFQGKNIVSLGIYAGELDENRPYQTSRENASSNFNRFKLSLARIQKISNQVHLMIRGTGQYTQDRLLPIDEVIIGGMGTVRGYEPARYIGDSGCYASAELMFPPPFIADKTIFEYPIEQLVQLALFVDTGYVHNNDPVAGEYSSANISGYGIGFRLFYNDRFSFKYDLGIPMNSSKAEDSSYHYFSLNFNLF